MLENKFYCYYYLSSYNYHYHYLLISYLQLILDYNDLMKIPVINDNIRKANQNSAKVR